MISETDEEKVMVGLTTAATEERRTQRRALRFVAAGLSVLTAVLYLLIGLNLVDLPGIGSGDQAAFAIPAAIVFIGGAVVAMRYDKRWLWIIGAAGLTLIVLMYFNVSSERDPAYEIWGILIRVVQIPLLVVLAYLALKPQSDDERE